MRRALAIGGGIALVAAGLAVAAVVLRGNGDGGEPELSSEPEPEPAPAVRLTASCGEGDFTLEFDGSGAALVRQGAVILARASADVREIECEAPVAETELSTQESPYHGDLAGPSYESATIACRTAARLEVSLHPILYRDAPSGSSLVVDDRRTKRLLAGANFSHDPAEERIWARAYWDEDACVVRP